MFKDVPRPYLVSLAIYFLLEIASILATDNMVFLARTVVIAIAAWRSLRGSRAAAIFLAVMMSLSALFGLYATFTMFAVDPIASIIQLILVAFIASIACYIFFSSKLKAYYAKSSAAYWGASS